MSLLRWLTLGRLVALIAMVGVFVIAFRPPLDTDVYWHLRAGQWQVEHRAVLGEDVFSSTRTGQSWVNVHWAAQIILYASYAALGDSGLSVFTALLATIGMAFIYRACPGDPLIRAFAVIFASMAAAIFWSPRSQMFSFLFGCVFVYLLWRYQRHRIDQLWLIPVLMIFWVNMHGGFAIGFILLVLALFGESLRWLFDGVLAKSAEADRATLKPVLRLAIIGLVSAGAALINPFGLAAVLLPFRTVGIGVLQDFIQEWASPDFHQPQALPFLLLLLATLTAAGLSAKRLDSRDAVQVAGTAATALLSGRNIATFAIVAAPVLALHTESWLADQGWSLNSQRAVTQKLAALNWMIAALVLAGAVVRLFTAIEPGQLEEARRQTFPVEAVAYLQEAQTEGPLFNSYNWGGYLVWAARDWPVFVDGRTDLYDDGFIRGYLTIYFGQRGWEYALHKSGVNLVLVETSSPLAQLLALHDDWSEDYRDGQAVIFTRNTGDD